MKRLIKNIKNSFLSALGLLVAVSCQKLEYRDKYEANEISNIYATYEGRGRDRLFEARIVDDKIYIDVDYYHPIDSDNEVDLSKLFLRATIPTGSTISPSLSELWDLTTPKQLTITSNSGVSKTYTVIANKQGNTDVSNATLTYESANGETQEVSAIIIDDKINFSIVPGTVLTNARLSYVINRHSTGSIPNGGSIDLSTAQSFVVSSVGNASRTYTLQTIEAVKLAKGIRPGSAKIMFAKRLKADLGISIENLTGGIAATGQYLVINTRNENSIYLNAFNGQKVGEIDLGSLRGDLKNFYSTADDAGNILVCNLAPNDGAFRISKISSVTATPQPFITWTPGSGSYGRKISVIGDINNNAIITAPTYGAASLNTFARWQVRNGELLSQTPTIVTVSGYSWSWSNADVIYTSPNDITSDYYLIGYSNNRLARVNGNTNTVTAQLDALGNFIVNAVDYIEFNNAKFVAYNHVNSFTYGVADQVFLIDTEGGFSGDPSASPPTTPGLIWAPEKGKYGRSASGGAQNANGTGDVAMTVSENGYYLYLYFMFTNGYVVGVQFDCVDIE